VKALIALEDGRTFPCRSFTGSGETEGEVVFNTSMTGYQEVLTDPSYRGQIVTMTYPLIGNVGVNPEDVESHRPFVEGFIVKELSPLASNWRSNKPLSDYLSENSIPAIEGIDTRALTRRLRTEGSLMGIMSTGCFDVNLLLERLNAHPGIVGVDLVKDVTCSEPYDWKETEWTLGRGYAELTEPKFRVAAYDFGIKRNILRKLASAGCEVRVFPAHTPAEEILASDPDGIFLSNGPGDPAPLEYVVENVKKLLGTKPVFGICLGTQLMALAVGADTYKMKYGHRSQNQPIIDPRTKRCFITSQNHGYAVKRETLPQGWKEWFVNLNDETNEGIRHESGKFLSTQFHPEAEPGPTDTQFIFDKFVEVITNN